MMEIDAATAGRTIAVLRMTVLAMAKAPAT
jgi:hypothetical protein